MSDRINGYAPLRDYAAIGDGRTVALIARDGAIDWFALPTVDAPPVFAALLDCDSGGHFQLAPKGAVTAISRRYVEHTNVLETTYTTPTGVVKVTDALNLGTFGILPWSELARRVDCVTGEVDMGWEVVPGDRFGDHHPWVHVRDGLPVATVGDQHLVVRAFDVGEWRVEDDTVRAEFTARAGDRGLVALCGVDNEIMVTAQRAGIEARLDHTISAWKRWTAGVSYEGPWREAVLRSALTLKLLIHAPSGAIAAAPTTSLPECIGGDRNFDYRYAWVRDSSFAIEALIQLGLHEEAHSTLSWLLDTVGHNAPDLDVFYRLDGSSTDAEHDRDHDTGLPGYRDSRPVRAGNAAIQQIQLGNFGDLLDSVWLYASNGHLIDADTESTLSVLAEQACDLWRQTDSGIWELPEQRHYTISKMGCWAALDRAVRLAEAGHLSKRRARRWASERDAVRRWIEENCWSSSKNSYTFYAGTDDLDAAVLLAARTGFAKGERLLGTIDAVRRELSQPDGPLLHRYSGMEKHEGAFVACSFWLADALVRANRLDEARELIEAMIGQCNDVGLLSEEIDSGNGEFLGNLPQALSHLALVIAAALFNNAAKHRGARR